MHSINDLPNNGSLSKEFWRREIVNLPPMLEEGGRVKLVATYNPTVGALGLDNMKVDTRQNCYPRWIKVHDFHLRDIGTKTGVEEKKDDYRFSSVTKTMIRKRALGTESKMNTTSETCQRFCTAGSGCDMFSWSWDHNTTSCYTYPHTALKEFWWGHYATYAPALNNSIYVLDCAGASENVLPESDLTKTSPGLWTETLTAPCINKGIYERVEMSRQSTTMGKHGHVRYKY